MNWPQTLAVVATGLFTLAGALGGTYLSSWQTHRLEAAARLDRRRDELREVIASVLVDAGDLIQAEWTYIPMLSIMDHEDLVEFSQTDSGQAWGVRSARLRRSLVEARLLVRYDSGLGKALEDMTVLHRHLTEEAHGPVTGRHKSKADKDAGVSVGFKYIGIMQRALNSLEARSLEELGSLGESPRQPQPLPAPPRE